MTPPSEIVVPLYTEPRSPVHEPTSLIRGSGEMAEMTRAFDWRASPLGSVAQWPEALLTTVNTLLSSRQPMFLFWGEALVQFYNDAYRPSLGAEKHPLALGQPGRDCWPEIWEVIGPQIESVLHEGEATWHENQLLPIYRDGHLEDVYWTYSYSPVWERSGTVGGVLVVCTETTGRVLAERELEGSLQALATERQRLLELFQQSPAVFAFLRGPEHVIEMVNPLYVKLMGGHDVRGKTVRDAMPEAAEQGYVDVLDRVYQTGEPFVGSEIRFDVKTRPGKRSEDRYLDFAYQPLREASGAISGVILLGVDVTERRKSTALLKENEARSSRILQSIGDAVIVTDAMARIARMNPVAEDLTGWREDEARGLPLHEVFRTVEKPPEVSLPQGAAMPLPEPTLLIRKDGTEIHVDDSGATIRDDAGQTTGIVLVFRNVSEKRRQEHALRAGHDLQTFLLKLADRQRQLKDPRQILEVAAESIGRHLNTGRVGYAEVTPDGASVLFETGWAQPPLFALSGTLSIANFGEEDAANLRRGLTLVYPDVRLDRRAGRQNEAIGALAVIAVPLMRGGIWRGSLYVNHWEPRKWTPEDIALVEQVAERTAEAVERAQVEAQLRQNVERLRLAGHAGKIASWEWELATDTLMWDEGCMWTYGRPAEQMGRVEQVLTYLHDEDRPAVLEGLRPVLEGVGGFRMDFRVIWPDGSIHWLQAIATPVRSPGGHVVRLVGVNMDITERKLAEAALIRNEKLAAVGRLASSIAHEINNPLEAMTNLVYLARTSDDLGEIREYLETTDAELRRVSAIANQTLRFHKQSTKPIEISCDDMLGGVLGIYHARMVNGGIQLEKRKRAHRPVLCFDGEIRQVLSNLVVNAIDAMQPTGGRLLVRSREGHDWKTGQEGLVLTIADTGPGMSRETLRRVFEAFFTTKGYGGTGLGLWISKDILDRHQGRLSVSSNQKEGRHGTVFTVFLPFKAADRSQGKTITPEPSILSKAERTA